MTERASRLVVIGTVLIAGLALAGCGTAEDEVAGAPDAGIDGVRYLAGSDESGDFRRATEPRAFVFPDDHRAHEGFRTEWWYFTGNVFDDDARHYGFELTIFRIALAAARADRESSLAANEVWMAHLAVTDTAREQFQVAERLSRGAPGLAGAAAAGEAPDAGSARGAGAAGEDAGPADTGRSDRAGSTGNGIIVHVEDFGIRFTGDDVFLAAADADFGIDLTLSGLDRIVAQGDGGLDPKGPEPGNASYYFSAPRLAVTGEIRSAGAAPVAVTGTAWMDREWSTSALSPDIAGWDWFALQLDDGRDLMFYRLRGVDGGTSPFSGGSIADANGNVTRLEAGSVNLIATRDWTSRRTGVTYPVGWRMTIPAQDLSLEIQPRLEDQELDVTVRYWEGAVSVSGSADGEAVSGVGYLELAGY